ncbi:hypothetical protein ACIQVR_37940 [Streptomyces xanthochromogenes]|uniref:hypothetical protein n=1 Tax=Streptomyces xanthochromogenes TaxID=67384 RepID=UPI0037F48D94
MDWIISTHRGFPGQPRLCETGIAIWAHFPDQTKGLVVKRMSWLEERNAKIRIEAHETCSVKQSAWLAYCYGA